MAFHHTLVLVQTIVTSQEYRMIPQCCAWYAPVSCTTGSVRNHEVGFDSPIAQGAILVEYSTFNRAKSGSLNKKSKG